MYILATLQNTKEALRFFYQNPVATESEHHDSIEFIHNLDPDDDLNTSLHVPQANPMHDF